MAAAPRLPGIRFETEPPPPTVILPRMDVAGLVGFASTGPLHIPVAVDDAAGFAEVFGADAPLAWDADLGQEATAYLGPAVRAFFRNGGRRCWVVRVADDQEATTSVFPLPGFVGVSKGSDVAPPAVAPAVLAARSPGSAADGLRVALSVAPRPVRLWITEGPTGVSPGGDLGTLGFQALVASPDDLADGDTIRVDFAGSDWSLVFAVTATQVADGAETSPPGGTRLTVISGTGVATSWVRIADVSNETTVTVSFLGLADSPPISATLSPGDAHGLVKVALALAPGQAPSTGAVLRSEADGDVLWLAVADVQISGGTGVMLTATPYEVGFEPPEPVPVQAAGAFAERLTLDLHVTDEGGASWTLGDLGLAATHPHFVGGLPSDASLFGGEVMPSGPLAQAVMSPRFPLAGPAAAADLYVPIGASILAGPALGPVAAGTPPRVRDGLGRFSATLFLDPRLAATSDETLLAEANWIRFQAPDPERLPGTPAPPPGAPGSRDLSGIHALMGKDEVTIVAAPDAVHRSWSAAPLSSPVTPSGDLSPPDLSPPDLSPPDVSPPGVAGWMIEPGFVDCAVLQLGAPHLSVSQVPEAGVYTVSWTAAGEDVEYELQESQDPSFGTAETIYEGSGSRVDIYGRARGASLYYRVRAILPAQSGWSNVGNVVVAAQDRFVLDARELYSAADLELVHSALLRMCCARGDMLAVLALPEHFGAEAAVSYSRALKGGGTSSWAPRPILSFGAIYHPWLYVADAANPTDIRRGPPDGPACGVIAASSNAVGAWVAPANVALQDVVALDHAIPSEALLSLKSAQVNVVRQQPHGFLWLSADTLSGDEDLRPIGVRRLLSALRRIAVLQGAAFAFEPNSDVLRRAIQREFEGILADMFSRGAFAEGTAASSYRVNVGSPPNTPASVEEGRLIVELAVAPSRPLAFLTIRLLRAGDGTLQVQAG